ncbi:acyl-CoA dehydrogenase family protein [Rhodococcus sp. NPDC127530]|uniref:acyl-CoA dehydrogenase family protein n=1 Tax=unclassified Rhodococcus (in: high G+C Gram-positive bacteria) TaxID=192944 RepID=UPI003629A9BC
MKRTIYNDDHDAFRTTIRDFLAKEVTPYFAEWEEVGHPPRELFRKLAGLGVTGFDIPEEFGGAGDVSFKYQAIIAEESALSAVAMYNYGISQGVVLPYLLNLANAEQRARWFPGIAVGDILLCIAMTEPGTGSDLAGIRTTARLSDDGTHYVLNGSKTFISGARNSELCVVAARTSAATAEDRRAGLSLLVVPTGSAGFTYGRKLDKIGHLASDTNELTFTDIRVPVENLLGQEGAGFSYLGQNLPRERLSMGVEGVSRATAAIEFALAYTKERTVFGKPVASFQNTKFVLAECKTEVSAAQAMVDKGLELEDTGELTAADAARIKLFCTEVAGRVIDKCLQLHGGYGYIREYPIARLYADTRVNRIYGGTSEVLKTIIAKDMAV